jgi:predicted Zn-dependent protease
MSHATKTTSAAVALAMLASCATVPVTGRHQLSLIPSSTMMSMSAQEYGQFLQQHPLSKDAKNTALVVKVGTDIQHAVERFFAEKNMASRLSGYKWEFNLVESKDPNAWCMPGGKVVVYTGILPLTKDATGLAVVLGHEIAHAVAEHGTERMSQGMLAEFGGAALSQALHEKPEATRAVWMTRLRRRSPVRRASALQPPPRERGRPSGSHLMAMAGYDPRAASISGSGWPRRAEARLPSS